jgi:hypothetical protein
MSGNPLFDYISSAAVSLTMAGNTGISPFLTLFLLGLVEMIKPELLNMGPTMETILASGWSIVILAGLAIAELVAKCIPALDEIIDSAETFIIPVISVLSTMATLGLLPGATPAESQADAGMGEDVDMIGRFYRDEDYRYLQEGDLGDDENAFSEGFLQFTKVSLVIVGAGLALAIHIFKMIVRVSSLVCSGGCCQPCITILEYTTVVVGVVLAIVLPAFAIIACVIIVGIALYVLRIKCSKQKDENDTDTDAGTKTITLQWHKKDNTENDAGKRSLEWEKDDNNDIEDQGMSRSTAPIEDPTKGPLDEAFVEVQLEEVPFDVKALEEVPFDVVPLSDPPKYDAKTY